MSKLIKYINENDLGFGWKNHPNRNHLGKYIEGEPFDYTIFTKYHKIVFDCKETDKKQWNIQDKDIKQGINLLKCDKVGIKAFFLIYFIIENEVMRIDIKNFFDILSTRKNIKQTDCTKFNYKEILEK